MIKNTVNANAMDRLKADLMADIDETAGELEELCDEVSQLMSDGGIDALNQAEILLICADADYGIQTARACVFRALHSDLSEEDAAEVVIAAAALYKATEQLQDYLATFLDEEMDAADSVLAEAMACMDEAEGDEDDDGVDVDFPEMEQLVRVMAEAGLINKGDEVVITISSDDEDGGDEADDEEVADMDAAAAAKMHKAIEAVTAWLVNNGLMQEDQAMTITIEPAQDEES